MFAPPPKTELELFKRAQALAGYSFAELAEEVGIQVPKDLRRNKGWVGQLIEMHLGAEAGSRPEQDFADLGIELKTIPLSHKGKPLESTFVCVAPLTGIHGITWQQSHVRQKLSKVLWVPVEGERELPLAERHVGFPKLWTPSQQQEQLLQDDWEELMEMITTGRIHEISARHGEVMQLRPKAANSRALTDAYGASGKHIKTLPRGFYLRSHFTHSILLDSH
ncbi:DNA mismatch repair endonuclease MutH [Vibrio sp. UCD-FRSSP16_10]|uniref:DNA mismatch repair endonuclease MutH n=1 Tax=unclassified Vibrio TaxID=2614977 RepID=UPI0007FD6B4F|nr:MULTISPECIES: DNA mismatch repair endonuclease MutH [unclassified Vibrio]OBT06640.1 DNA mismatch repair endonuclease MutH [Vibrio sp. UCD-FRSSP16_30]OBT12337.1 DNA mismatch repair endonuclease MutH [Vibrio sp. UCD-FRSSP16_10]